MTGAQHRVGVLAAVLAALVLAGRPVSLKAELAASSPFLPSGAAALGASSGPSGPIELRGIMATADGVQYCIYDTASKKSTWVGLNEGGHNFTVKQAVPNSDQVAVDYQGRIFQLEMHTPKVVSSGNASASTSVVTQQAVGTPSPAEEQRRLDAVAQEVRRRRLEREKALQPGQDQQGGAPAPVGR
jgi:hypothetical protein